MNTPLTHRFDSRMNATLRVLAVLVAAGLAAGCRDITAAQAIYTVSPNDTLTVYALNGTPPGAPTAIELGVPSTARVDASFSFSIAFDLDSANRPVVIPVQLVANGLAGTNQVGFQRTSTAYDAITKAPGGNYHYDSTYVLPAGQPVVAEVVDATRCAVSLYSSTYYAKFMVAAVDTAQRTLKVVVTTDPNCGFRSLEPGVKPKS